jgi:hypothetical protein
VGKVKLSKNFKKSRYKAGAFDRKAQQLSDLPEKMATPLRNPTKMGLARKSAKPRSENAQAGPPRPFHFRQCFRAPGKGNNRPAAGRRRVIFVG